MTAFVNSIKRLIQRRGNTNFSLISYSQVIDPDNPLNVINTKTQEELKSWQGNYKADKIDGTIIKDTDVKLYVDASYLTSTPEINNKVVNGTVTYTIKNIKSWKVQDTVHLYIFKLRV